MEWFEEEIDEARSASRARLHKIQFSFVAFFVKVLEQAFFPISLLWILPIHGRGSMSYIRNSQLIPLPIHPPMVRAYALMSFTQCIMLWCSHALLLTSSRYRMHHLWPVVMVADIVHLMRFTVIGIKYGFLTARQRRVLELEDFETSFKLQQSVQLMSTFVTAHPPKLFAEVEHTAIKKQFALTASLNDTFGYDVSRQTVKLASGSRSRLRARIAYDIKRIGLNDRYTQPTMQKLSEAGGGQCPLSALLVATRMAAQPKAYRSSSTNRYHILLATFLVLIPFAAPVHMEVPGGTRLIWLLPPGLCSCELDCSSASCFCTSVIWSDVLLLVCVWAPLTMALTFIGNFLKLAVVESHRRGRSLYLWGRVLHRNGFPKVRWVYSNSASGESAQNVVRVPRGSYRASASSSQGGERRPSTCAFGETESSETMLCEIVDGDDDGEGEENTNDVTSHALRGANAVRFYNNVTNLFRTHNPSALRTVDEDAREAASGDPSYRDHDHHDSPGSVPDEPLLEIEDPESWQAWHVGRMLLQHFGGLFHTRMDAYVSAFTFEFVLLLISVLAYMVQAQPGEANVQLIYSTLFLLVIVGGPIVCVLVMLMNANWQFTTDKHMISHACTGLRYRLAVVERTAEASPDDADARQSLRKMQRASAMLESLIEQLGSDEKANPLRFIFVVPVTYEFVGASFAGVGAAATYFGTLIAQTLADQYSSYYRAVHADSSNSTDSKPPSPLAPCAVLEEYPYDAAALHLALVGIAVVAFAAYCVGIFCVGKASKAVADDQQDDVAAKEGAALTASTVSATKRAGLEERVVGAALHSGHV